MVILSHLVWWQRYWSYLQPPWPREYISVYNSILVSVDKEYDNHESHGGIHGWEEWKYLLPRFVNFH